MFVRSRRVPVLAGATLLVAAPMLVAPAAHAADPVSVTLVDINDFHGRIDTNTTAFATTLEQIRQSAGEANTAFLSVGDNIGASLFASATQQDQPTLDVLNALDLQASAVGNHEFDQGYADLTGRVDAAADFPYLGANVSKDGQSLQKSAIITVSGLKLAVIGAVTEETPSLVSPAGIEGVTFSDPVAAVNTEAERLEALPAGEKPDLIVAAYHEGAGAGTPDGASLAQEVAAGGAFAHIVNDTDASVDAILTGHTHKEYAWDAPVPGADRTRPIIQTGSYGANIGKTVLQVDPDTDTVTGYTVQNVPRVAAADTSLPRVAEVKSIVDQALAYAKTKGEQKVGDITADITTAYAGGKRDDRASESTLGNLVPDAMLALSKTTPAPADLSLNNPGGLRNELLYAGDTANGGPANTDGVVTFAEANSVLPFTNNLFTVTLSGAALKKVFEQQWQRDTAGNVPSRPYLQLGMSKNVKYTYDSTRAEGDRITGVWINGTALDPAASYRVVVPSFLATGGDNFRAFTEGSFVDTGVVDYQGWISYLGDNSPVSPDFARRSVEVRGIAASYQTGDTVSFSLPRLDLTSLGSPANTTATAVLNYGKGKTLNLGTQAVSGGASGTFSFTLPEGAAGTPSITVTAQPSGTTATIPLKVTKAPPKLTADDVTVRVGRWASVTLVAPKGVSGFVVAKGANGRTAGLGLVLGGNGTLLIPPSAKPGTYTYALSFRGTAKLPDTTVTVTVTPKG